MVNKAIVLLCEIKKNHGLIFWYSTLNRSSESPTFPYHKKVRVKSWSGRIIMELSMKKSIQYKLEWLRTYTEYKVCNEVTDWAIIHRWMSVCTYFLYSEEKNHYQESERKKRYTNMLRIAQLSSHTNLVGHDSWFLYRNQMKLASKTHFRKMVQGNETKEKENIFCYSHTFIPLPIHSPFMNAFVTIQMRLPPLSECVQYQRWA